MNRADSHPSEKARVSAAKLDLAIRLTLFECQVMGQECPALSFRNTICPPWLEPSLSLLKLASAYIHTWILGVWSA